MKRNRIVIVLGLIITLALCGCGKGKDNEDAALNEVSAQSSVDSYSSVNDTSSTSSFTAESNDKAATAEGKNIAEDFPETMTESEILEEEVEIMIPDQPVEQMEISDDTEIVLDEEEKGSF